jgi:hypothetical protein
MISTGTRVLFFVLLSTSACVLERGERTTGSIGDPVPAGSNDPNDPNCGCPNGSHANPANVDFTGVTEVTIEGFDGRIDLDANAAKPSIDWTARGNVTVSVDRHGSSIDIHANKPSVCISCGIDFDVHLPVGLDVKLTTSNGGMHCGGSVHSLVATTSNARVDLASLSGNFAVTTSNGAVGADDVTLVGDCTISTSNGSIVVTKLHTKLGQRVEGTTSNGDVCVNLDGFTVDKTNDHFLATSCGTETGSLVVDTSNGSICVSNH